MIRLGLRKYLQLWYHRWGLQGTKGPWKDYSTFVATRSRRNLQLLCQMWQQPSKGATRQKKLSWWWWYDVGFVITNLFFFMTIHIFVRLPTCGSCFFFVFEILHFELHHHSKKCGQPEQLKLKKIGSKNPNQFTRHWIVCESHQVSTHTALNADLQETGTQEICTCSELLFHWVDGPS